mmetsp:Transcript_32195/g.90153  ORF Transcript_32195/g.90153 Transcript_32195/m.90153 type:complete len:483 (-) Transcript_32195:580-2028(-)
MGILLRRRIVSVVAACSLVLWGEVLVWDASHLWCGYPAIVGEEGDLDAVGDGVTDVPHVSHVAVVTDPQLTDPYSYEWPPRDSVLERALLSLCDQNMRRSFATLQRWHDPDVILVLGDLFDSTRFLEEHEYAAEYARWRATFPPRPRAASRRSSRGVREAVSWPLPERRVRSDADALLHSRRQLDDALRYPLNHQPPVLGTVPPVHVIAGNHDIGWAIQKDQMVALAEQFEEHFGALNFFVRVGTFHVVGLCAPCFSNNVLRSHTEEFLRALQAAPALQTGRTVLLSHIPLWRPLESSCGHLRPPEKSSITHKVGPSYSNVVPRPHSTAILEMLDPVVVLSGDDHDPCVVTHSNGAVEYTVGTFSWLQGTMSPSYALMALDNAEGRVHVSYCFLPNQYALFGMYGVAAPLLLCLMVAWHCLGAGTQQTTLPLHMRRDFRRHGPPPRFVPRISWTTRLWRGVLDTAVALTCACLLYLCLFVIY